MANRNPPRERPKATAGQRWRWWMWPWRKRCSGCELVAGHPVEWIGPFSDLKHSGGTFRGVKLER